MPKLPYQLDLPGAFEPSTAFGRWASSLLVGLQRQWTSLVRVVNALDQPAFAPGPFEVPSGSGMVMTKRLTLSSDQRVQLGGTARLRIT